MVSLVAAVVVDQVTARTVLAVTRAAVMVEPVADQRTIRLPLGLRTRVAAEAEDIKAARPLGIRTALVPLAAPVISD